MKKEIKRLLFSIVIYFGILASLLFLFAISYENFSIYGKQNEVKYKIEYKIGSPKMIINGSEKEIDPGRNTVPIILNNWNRTLVPIRSLIEAVGGRITWYDKEKKVSILFNSIGIVLLIDNPKASVNGKEIWIDEENHGVKPIILNGRTFLPLRFIAENLGFTVLWNGEQELITLIFPQKIIQLSEESFLFKITQGESKEILVPIRNNNSYESTFSVSLHNISSPKGWMSEFCIGNACYFKDGEITLKPKEEINVQVFIHTGIAGTGEFVFCIGEKNKEKECINITLTGGE